MISNCFVDSFVFGEVFGSFNFSAENVLMLKIATNMNIILYTYNFPCLYNSETILKLRTLGVNLLKLL